MKVGYLIPEFPGQTHIFFWREVQALRRCGIEVDFVSTRRPPPSIVSHVWSAEAIGRTTYLFPPRLREVLGGLLELLRVGPAAWARAVAVVLDAESAGVLGRLRITALLLPAAQLVKLARGRGWRHIHVHSCASSAAIAALASQLGGLKYSLTLHGPIGMYGPAQRAKWSCAEFGISVTKRLREEVFESVPDLPSDCVEVAAMGVDLEVFQRRAGYSAARPDGSWSIVSCGRLHAGKGHQDVVEAVSLLKRQGRSVHLTVLGEGPARPMLEALIRERELGEQVQLAGAASENAVRDALGDAGLFVLGSHDEAIGVATMEAMAMELPVVVTDVGGVRELVRDGVDGLLVPSRNPLALADAIVSVLADPDQARKMGLSGAERIREAFSSEVSAQIIARRLGLTTPAAQPASSPVKAEPACR